jgi:hypothetical protein
MYQSGDPNLNVCTISKADAMYKYKNAIKPYLLFEWLDKLKADLSRFFRLQNNFGIAMSIHDLLRDQGNVKTLLHHLEQNFLRFLNGYGLKIQIPNPEFANWVYNKENFSPSLFPLPTSNDLLQAKKLKKQSALTLFFYHELLRLGYFNAPLEDSLIYCTGYAKPEKLNEKLMEEKLFVDAGYFRVTGHGKYTHLLQLILIAYAQNMGIISKHYSGANLVKWLIETKASTADGTRPFWDIIIDHLPTRGADTYSSDPFSLNITMLLDPDNQFPMLHRYWSFSYIKNLIKQVQFESKSDSEKIDTGRIESYLEGYLKNLQNFPPNQGHVEEWRKGKNEKIVELYRDETNNMFYKILDGGTKEIAEKIYRRLKSN